jgi:GNAT superfamily N-acetyltransferase
MKGRSRVTVEPSGRYHLRDATDADLPHLGALQHAALADEVDTREPDLPLAALDLCRAAGTLWVAVGKQDELAGYLAASEIDGALFILAIGILPEHRRLGLAAALLERAIDHARWAYLPAVTMIVDTASPWLVPALRERRFVMLDEQRASTGLRDALDAQARAGEGGTRLRIMARLM